MDAKFAFAMPVSSTHKSGMARETVVYKLLCLNMSFVFNSIRKPLLSLKGEIVLCLAIV